MKWLIPRKEASWKGKWKGESRRWMRSNTSTRSEKRISDHCWSLLTMAAFSPANTAQPVEKVRIWGGLPAHSQHQHQHQHCRDQSSASASVEIISMNLFLVEGAMTLALKGVMTCIKGCFYKVYNLTICVWSFGWYAAADRKGTFWDLTQFNSTVRFYSDQYHSVTTVALNS